MENDALVSDNPPELTVESNIIERCVDWTFVWSPGSPAIVTLQDKPVDSHGAQPVCIRKRDRLQGAGDARLDSLPALSPVFSEEHPAVLSYSPTSARAVKFDSIQHDIICA